MDKKGELDIAHSCIAFCNTNDITLYTSRSESFASGGDSIRFQSNRYADSGGTNRPSFSAQSVGSWRGSDPATGYAVVFGKSERACTGMASRQGKGRGR